MKNEDSQQIHMCHESHMSYPVHVVCSKLPVPTDLLTCRTSSWASMKDTPHSQESYLA